MSNEKADMVEQERDPILDKEKGEYFVGKNDEINKGIENVVNLSDVVVKTDHFVDVRDGAAKSVEDLHDGGQNLVNLERYVQVGVGVTPLSVVGGMSGNFTCCNLEKQFFVPSKDFFYVEHQYAPRKRLGLSMDDGIGIERRIDPPDKGYMSDEGNAGCTRIKSFMEELEEESSESNALNKISSEASIRLWSKGTRPDFVHD
ncbi:unnamed protein product [Ilex paraguariensis]|uniref:Uncharacterized protein n=1 Tax=Ilex paraguariensis TaxID=185542 RepID=A0ABC8RBK8_9AQUA